MKTTFKEVFRELDDEMTNIGINSNYTPDIDVEKIKGEVFMRINENSSGKKMDNYTAVGVIVKG